MASDTFAIMRLEHLHPDELDDAQRGLYDAITGGDRRQAHATLPPGAQLTNAEGRLQGPFNALLHHPELGRAILALTGSLRFHGTLAAPVRELVILIVAAAEQSDFEWAAHAPLAEQLGIEAQTIDAIASERYVELEDPLENAAAELARGLVTHGELDDESYHRCQRELGDQAVIEISTLVGVYQLIAMQMRLFRVAGPEGPWRK